MPTEDDALNRICEEVEAEWRHGPQGANNILYAKAVARRYAATVGAGVREDTTGLLKRMRAASGSEDEGGDCSCNVAGGSDAWQMHDRFCAYRLLCEAADWIEASPDHPVKSGDGDGWRRITDADRCVERKARLLIAQYPQSNGWSDIYSGWWDARARDWTRWPHTFPPTHCMDVGVPTDAAPPSPSGKD